MEKTMINTFAHMDINNKSRATIAIRVDGENMEIGVSFCSPLEQFSKVGGRERAEGRLNTHRGYYFATKRNSTLKIKEQASQLVLGLCGMKHADAIAAGWIIGNPHAQVQPKHPKRVPRW